MDKVKALQSILIRIENVKLLGAFPEKRAMLKKLNNLYDMVDSHYGFLNYNELCAKEADIVFDKIKELLKYGK